MKRETLPTLVGAAIGFAVGFFMARAERNDHERIIVLKKRPNGKPGLEISPEDIEIKKGRKLTWWIANQTDDLDVLVSLEHWRSLSDVPKDPAVNADPDPNDSEDPQNGLSRLVRRGKVKKIQSRARGPEAIIFPEEVRYDVHLNGELALDPIVKLVL